MLLHLAIFCSAGCESLYGYGAALSRTLTLQNLMQVSWEVMAGHLPTLVATTAGAVPEMGVFVGIQQMEYGGLAAPHLSSLGPYSASGSPFSVAAGRLSFTYNLKGAISSTIEAE